MLAAGTALGPYKILVSLGAGGMGEVYRASDTRLGRHVAIKVIPPELARDHERVKRFEREARAAGSLSHPNVCTLFDVGTHEGAPYVVMELLEGESLRARLGGAPLPVRNAIDYAVQIARGLAAAHAKGIVHRDLKPENLFVTKDGRVKVLDFGLAKLTRPEALGATGERTVSILSTESGAILGTAGYMAPEQVRGEAADARSDLFALGAILHELLTGKRAFAGASFVETGHAILNDEPAPLAALRPDVPPGLDAIVRRCLEKEPTQRFQSAADLAFALEALREPNGKASPSAARDEAAGRARRNAGLLVVAGLSAAVAVASLVLLAAKQREMNGRAAAVSYERITFRRGAVSAARFAPDGKAVYYTATWDGEPLDLFETEPGSVASRSLGIPQSHLLSISKAGMAALSLGSDQFIWLGMTRVGALAELPIAGGAPHRLLEEVRAADWSSDGTTLAVARQVSGRDELQMPPGHAIYRSAGWITHLRIAPSGGWLAFQEHTSPPNIRGNVVIIDTRGKVLARSPEWRTLMGLAWSASGGEVWYSAPPAKGSWEYDLRAMSPDGRDRVVQCFPGMIALYDIAQDGRVLLARSWTQAGIRGRRAPTDAEIELGWQDYPYIGDLSPDGRTLLFTETGGGGGRYYSTYLRDMDGSPPVRIGEGTAMSLSPDGKRVLTVNIAAPHRLVVLPVGVGDSTSLPRGRMEKYAEARWMPDGNGVVFFGAEAGSPWRTYLQDVNGGLPRPITPGGVDATCVSLDGRFLAGVVEQGLTIFPTGGGAPRTVTSLLPEEQVVCWSADGRSLFVGRQGTVSQIDVNTGRRTAWKTFRVPDPAGVWVRSPVLAQKSQGYAYGYLRWLDDLYLVEGLK